MTPDRFNTESNVTIHLINRNYMITLTQRIFITPAKYQTEEESAENSLLKKHFHKQVVIQSTFVSRVDVCLLFVRADVAQDPPTLQLVQRQDR